MTHHLAICFASRSNQSFTSFMANNAGSFRIKKGRVLVLPASACNLIWSFFGRFLGAIFYFLHFIHGSQGSKKPPSSCPGQVDSPFGQVTFSPSLPNGQGPRQAVRRLNFLIIIKYFNNNFEKKR